MFNIGAGEMVLIAVAALLILGPKRLPELARGLGKFMREFRRQTDEVRNVVEREFYSMDTDHAHAPLPPVRPGSPFSGTSPVNPGAMPEPSSVTPAAAAPVEGAAPAEGAVPVEGAAPDAAAQAAPPRGTEVLELDAGGPRPVEPAALTPDTPVPVPGTVARNAPKRS